ncbi:hypothetical protein BU24DRAFT_457113 [Aaosphaeria arxii CBS 175.79]|uniref:Uncharacterized protein n=1 Tax=Aaosphaeria arxii CBS 175.79 TaxID=1450172 RepID=A0A6A5Y729_9PLEO|nr:uncharacterized protein BU24DRAFT_457113 [Aaosphaeria arxii CBS 175.79]KAF2021099.1 hypothetical protein BU24DRAFT_457113 [Aaosphaeria arxii CBS 175.79]
MDPIQPPFLFRIDEISERSDIVPPRLDKEGRWNPSSKPGSHIRTAGGVSGQWFYLDGQSIRQIDALPETGCEHHSTMSVYYSAGLGFWIMKGDATAIADERESAWHTPKFDHISRDYSSFITYQGPNVNLRIQRSDQTWPAFLLPDIYHTSERTDAKHLGGLTGELPIFIAFLALATRPEWLANAIPILFSEGSWKVHSYVSPRQHKRGVVVSVYSAPFTWNGGSNKATLTQYEDGDSGNFFS